MSSGLQGIWERLEARMGERNAIREKALADSRHLVRTSANAIRAVHRGEMEAAAKLLEEAGLILIACRSDLARFPDIYWSGYVQDAQKEYAEACITYSVVSGRPIPGPEDLMVEDAAYLNGMGEAVGELRRQVLDLVRRGEIERAEDLLGRMDEIYSMLITFDYPEAITGGLRRTTDMVRSIMERTRGELTVAWKQHQLQRALEQFAERFPVEDQRQPKV